MKGVNIKDGWYKPLAPGEIDTSTGELGAEIARIAEIWTDCRARFGAVHPTNGPFLFGAFGAADAFYAPVATRLHSYGVALEGAAAAYRDALLAWPDLVAWTEAARAEPWTMRTGEA
jgi:glutathione S-transferase